MTTNSVGEKTLRLLLVDLSSVFHWKFHASAGKPIDTAYQWTVNRVRELARGFDHVAICCDSGKSFRVDVDANYKANRPPRDPAMYDQMDRVCETLAADGYLLWKAKGFEADDIIATAVTWAVEQHLDTTIAGTDKDLLALVQPGVTMIKVHDGEAMGPDTVLAKFGVDPHQMRDYLALVGDSSDNVKGIPGVGPKHAARLLQQFKSIPELYKQLDLKDDKDAFVVTPESIRKALVEGVGTIDKAKRLVTLRADVPIACAEVLERREAKPISAPRSVTWEEDERHVEPEAEIARPVEFELAPARLIETTKTNGHVNGAKKTVMDNSQNGKEGGALAVISPTDPRWALALEPRTPKEAMQMAESLFMSKLFSAYGNPDAVLAVILMGRSMGLDAMTALRGMHVIEGRVTCSAQLAVALILRSSKADYFKCVATTDKSATWRTHRKGDPDPEPTSLTWTTEMAEQAKLIKQEKPDAAWNKYRPTMLRWRAAMDLARMVYPDVVGNVYTPDEIDPEIVEADYEVRPLEAVA